MIRWRKEDGGLRVDQAKRFKELEKESVRLKGFVEDLSLEYRPPALETVQIPNTIMDYEN